MPYWRLFYHLVWTVKGRVPLLVPPVEEDIHRALFSLCEKQGGQPCAVNGMPDHIHVVSSIPPSKSVAHFVKNLKGTTSHMMTHNFNSPFEWQAGYGAFSISERNLKPAIDYVIRQKEHHAQGTIIPRFERFKDEPDD